MISFSAIKWNKAHHQYDSFFDLEPTKTICHITSYGTFVVSNFSVILIGWLLTVDSEMVSFLFRSIRLLRICFISFKTLAIQEKLVA